MTVRDRALWLVLIALTIFVGVTGLYELQIGAVQRQQDRDMCELTGALLPSVRPTPTSTYGAAQRNAVVRYRASRCR